MAAANKREPPVLVRVYVIGAGPVGLYLVALLPKQNSDGRLIAAKVLEKTSSIGTPDASAFGETTRFQRSQVMIPYRSDERFHVDDAHAGTE